MLTGRTCSHGDTPTGAPRDAPPERRPDSRPLSTGTRRGGGARGSGCRTWRPPRLSCLTKGRGNVHEATAPSPPRPSPRPPCKRRSPQAGRGARPRRRRRRRQGHTPLRPCVRAQSPCASALQPTVRAEGCTRGQRIWSRRAVAMDLRQRQRRRRGSRAESTERPLCPGRGRSSAASPHPGGSAHTCGAQTRAARGWTRPRLRRGGVCARAPR
mmetsp:Transcript_664/g.1962  ORF Transcript_664/g.1962 Transcript_664/m.1962 type:complete len:213 (+) Transcript_664:936-1574(+)